MGRTRTQRALNAFALVFVAVCIPWVIGTRFLSPFILIPLACLSVFLVADLVVDSFNGDDRNLASKAAACILVGWLCGVVIIVAGIAGLNVLIRTGRWLLPDGEILADALGTSLGACVLVAGVTWRVLGKAKANSARVTMKLVIVVATVLSIYGCNRWQTEGSFVLTTGIINWIAALAGAGMFVSGVGLMVLPRR